MHIPVGMCWSYIDQWGFVGRVETNVDLSINPYASRSCTAA